MIDSAAACVDRRLIALDARLDVLGVLGSEVDRDANLAWVQVGFICERRDALLLAAFEFTEAGDDFPDIWPGGKRGSAVMRWTAEDDAGVVERVDAFDDESFEQRSCAETLVFGANCQSLSSFRAGTACPTARPAAQG